MKLSRRIALPLVGALAVIPFAAAPASAATLKPLPSVDFATVGKVTGLNASARTVTITVQTSSLDHAGQSITASLPGTTNPLLNGKAIPMSTLPLNVTAVFLGNRKGTLTTLTRLSAVKK